MKAFIRVYLLLLIVLIGIGPSEVRAAGTADITITATPSYVGISVTPLTWIINGITGDSRMRTNTTYYSNPLGDVVSPSATVLDSECRFTLINGSTLATDISINIANFIGGDASTNTNLGSNGPTSFGAYTYVSGDLFTNKVVGKVALSDNLIENLPAGTNKKFGIQLTTQLNPWTLSHASSSITTVVATEH